MVYKFRAILDTEEDVFRDIAILSEDTLEDLHNALVNAFGFDGAEVASFYTCDENWNQEDEIPLFDTGDVAGEQMVMADYQLSSILNEDQTKIIYVYDFMNMWTFLVELAAIEEEQAGEAYPAVLFSHGVMPGEAPNKEFESENEMDFDEDEFDEDDFDEFGDSENFEDYGFEENWN
ncbi:hypothetical protein HUK80_09600 [Flavobacterium sp. MAH-1]|uniref:Plasmid pRiA4b Orf3-like domain-containing protein n=1 Tax=Flavobacterium agri TaxID=2743471 RepID=A0A7Y8Y234_9FLAO|nr:hypothetical protein [Flavobacterium agri]NUY81147.1 hypothetical protein [Flavobacterium agri]NYA71171.1 hypothetical protein [Flavobacterium agri]